LYHILRRALDTVCSVVCFRQWCNAQPWRDVLMRGVSCSWRLRRWDSASDDVMTFGVFTFPGDVFKFDSLVDIRSVMNLDLNFYLVDPNYHLNFHTNSHLLHDFILSTIQSTTTSTTCAVGFLFLYEQWGSMHKRVVFFSISLHFCWLINNRWHDMNWCDIFWVDKFVSLTPYNVCCRFNNILYFFTLSPDAAHTCCLLSLTKSTDSYLALQ